MILRPARRSGVRTPVPKIGEPGGETWGDVPNEERRGGSAWMPSSYDPELDMIFVGVAVPIPLG
jgi:alcohol dehydrogenase (cytochrome c)